MARSNYLSLYYSITLYYSTVNWFWFRLLSTANKQRITIRFRKTLYAYFGGGNAVDERDLLEASVGKRDGDFPAVAELVVYELERLAVVIGAVLEAELDVLFEVGDPESLSVQEHAHVGSGGRVVRAASEQTHRVAVERLHAELVEVGHERDAREVLLPADWIHFRLAGLVHIARPDLLEPLAVLVRARLHLEARWEDVAQLRAEPVAAACHLLLSVVVVRRGEQVTEDERWNEHLVLAMLSNRNTLPVVPDSDFACRPTSNNMRTHK